jgi:hypothetical protein
MGDDTPILALPARCFQIVGGKAGIDTAFSCSCNLGEIGHESQTIIEMQLMKACSIKENQCLPPF